MRDDRYLLAQHNSRRRERLGRWGLPGGRLRPPEKPKACLQRELIEELGCRVPYLKRLGDWVHDGELHRVFGCEIDEPIETFAGDELLAIGWFTYEEIAELAAAAKLRTGFELAAITEFRRYHFAR
jgi:8-oxo-dGTP pyrophosphatase MutT (NUDIX family)